jgi:RHS repeat-associated protein
MTTTSGPVYYHHDGLGSTVALTDAAGAKIESYTYDVFGTVSIFDAAGFPQSSSTAGNRFLFTGREFVKEANLYDYRNRVYSAEIGRFLQTDPIQFDAGDVNLYRYVGNQVILWSDPLGLAGPSAPVILALGPAVCAKIAACRNAVKRMVKELAEECKKVKCKFALHTAHHPFPGRGKLCHLQVNCYLQGKPGSEKSWRMAIPDRFCPDKDHHWMLDIDKDGNF